MIRRVLITLVAITILAGAPVASAAEAEGCLGTIASQGADRHQLDSARIPGANATFDDPLVIDPGGTLSWFGEAQDVMTDASWSVTAAGIPMLSGVAANTEEVRIREGLLDLTTIPAPASWLFSGAMVVPVSGSISSDGGSCTASGYVSIEGSPATSPVFFAGLVALVLGILVLVGVASRTRAYPEADFLTSGYSGEDFGVDTERHPVVAFGGGVLVGVGAVLLLFVFGIVPVSWGWLVGCAVGFGLLAVVGAFVVPARESEDA